MKKRRDLNIWDALKQWSGLGKFIDFRPYGNGHIKTHSWCVMKTMT